MVQKFLSKDLGQGENNWIFFVGNIFLTGILFSFFNGIIAAGEELAWRGFLQNVLIDKLGITKSENLWH